VDQSGTNLASLSTDDLAELSAEIGQTLCVVFKVSATRATIGVERQIASAIDKAWKGTAKSALNTGLSRLLRGRLTQRRLDVFLRSLDIELKTPLTAAQIRVIRGRLQSIWNTSKRLAGRQTKKAVDFSLVDREAVAALSRQQVFWVGDFYGAQLNRRIAAVSQDVIFEQGLSSREAGPVLRRALNREFGLVTGGKTGFAPSIPARYAGNPDHYFRQVASVSSHQARTFSTLQHFTEAEITRFRLINPQDERTGKICQQMHGQTFSVRTGERHMNRILSAKDPKAVKRIAPWLSGDEIEDELGGKRRGSVAASDALSRAGVILPPFHSSCRTEPVVIA
jgi:hypothetical protein